MYAIRSYYDRGRAVAIDDAYTAAGFDFSGTRAFDARDSTSLERPAEDFARAFGAGAGAGEAPLAGLRVGVPREFFGEGLAPGVRAAIGLGPNDLGRGVAAVTPLV